MREAPIINTFQFNCLTMSTLLLAARRGCFHFCLEINMCSWIYSDKYLESSSNTSENEWYKAIKHCIPYQRTDRTLLESIEGSYPLSLILESTTRTPHWSTHHFLTLFFSPKWRIKQKIGTSSHNRALRSSIWSLHVRMFPVIQFPDKF